MSQESIEARVARLEAANAAANELRISRDREIRDVKNLVVELDAKIDRLLEDKTARDTTIGLGKWIVGTGFLAWAGGGLLWAWEMLKASGR